MQKWLGNVIRVALTAAILAVFAWQLNLRSVIDTLSTISPAAGLAAVLLVLMQTVVAAQRLAMVVARFGVKFQARDSVRVTLESMFFSQTFISFLGGDALRIWRIRRLGLPLAEATSAVMLDRLAGILVNHFFLLISLPWLLLMVKAGSVRLALGLLGATGVAGFAFLLVLGSLRGRGGYLHRLREWIPNRRLETLIVEASTVGRYFLTQYHHLARVFLVSIVIAVGHMIVFATILLGMGVDVSLAFGCALLVPAILEITMLPISIAGWGVREGAAVLAFGALGLPPHQALGGSLAFGLIGAGVSLLGGVLWIGDRRQLAKAPLHTKAEPDAIP